MAKGRRLLDPGDVVTLKRLDRLILPIEAKERDQRTVAPADLSLRVSV